MTPAKPTEFDRTARIALRIPVSERVLELSYPTDEQWEAWLRRLVGRGGSAPKNPIATKELITHLAGGVPQGLTDAEAEWLVNQIRSFLARAVVQGKVITLDCTVFGGVQTSFKLKAPTLQQMTDYFQVETLSENVGGEMVEALNVDAQKELVEDLLISHSGYIGEPPLGHKIMAANRALMEVAAMANQSDRGFFVTPQAPASKTSPSGSSAAGGKATTSDPGEKNSDAQKHSDKPALEDAAVPV